MQKLVFFEPLNHLHFVGITTRQTADQGGGELSRQRGERQEQARQAISTNVFTQPSSSEPMHPQSPAWYMQKFSKHYNIPGLHPHKLRHTFASIAITNGADVASGIGGLGHSDEAVTPRMYTHADQKSISQAAQIARDAIKKAGQQLIHIRLRRGCGQWGRFCV